MEILNHTARRLIEYGLAEREAHAVSMLTTLPADADDDVVTDAVIRTLVAAKEAVSGRVVVEYLGGQRRDTLRGDGRGQASLTS